MSTIFYVVNILLALYLCKFFSDKEKKDQKDKDKKQK